MILLLTDSFRHNFRSIEQGNDYKQDLMYFLSFSLHPKITDFSFHGRGGLRGQRTDHCRSFGVRTISFGPIKLVNLTLLKIIQFALLVLPFPNRRSSWYHYQVQTKDRFSSRSLSFIRTQLEKFVLTTWPWYYIFSKIAIYFIYFLINSIKYKIKIEVPVVLNLFY